jgi:hypothetical protein
MKPQTLLLAALWIVISTFPVRAITNEPVRVFMPDGQIKSHLLRVYITEDITEADKPTLTLLAGQFLLESLPSWAERTNSYRELARFQHWTETVDGQQISRTGTLLVFDLRKAAFPVFKACMRVTPVIKWGQPTQTAIGDRAVYVGNMIGATLWTAVFVGAVVLLIFGFTWIRKTDGVEGRKPNFKWLLLNPEGRLSLSKTQVAVWTLCIGVTVFIFGLTRLAPPVIPETLVALMGLSVGTRLITYTQEEVVEKKCTPQLSDLVHSKAGGKYELSITKAQMLYWTCVVACLFVLKSSLDGELWDVPWQLVALMGISQATYIVPVVKPKDGDSEEQKGKKGDSGAVTVRASVPKLPNPEPPVAEMPAGK